MVMGVAVDEMVLRFLVIVRCGCLLRRSGLAFRRILDAVGEFGVMESWVR